MRPKGVPQDERKKGPNALAIAVKLNKAAADKLGVGWPCYR